VYEFAVLCESCGARWRIVADEEPDYVPCVACGEMAKRITLIGTMFEP
jgi:hypothetical protein